jgi:hypothetical protein
MNEYIFTCDQILPEKVEVRLLNFSIGSALRKLLVIGDDIVPLDYLMQILNTTTCVQGVAGSGKTTEACKKATKNDLYIAMTTFSVAALRSKIPNKKIPVMSLEKAMTTYNKHVDTLYIDEASLIDLVFFGALINRIRPNKVHMTGDVN